jgi:manganese/zinc/iron transport system permease protein
MYHIAESHADISHPHEIKILNSFQGYTKATLNKLVEKNYVTLKGSTWSLTNEGFDSALNLYNQLTKNDE